MGRALGWLAHRLDIPVEATWNRSREAADDLPEMSETTEHTWGRLPEALESMSLEHTVLWLTVVDDALETTAEQMAPHIGPKTIGLHTCGSRSASVLHEAGWRGSVGSVHPLLAITEPRRAADEMEEVTWTIEGDDEAVDYARSLLVEGIGARVVKLEPGESALYHASASTAANLLVGLLDVAIEMAESAGLERHQAREMLIPLARSSLHNADADPLDEALSGPLARGDRATIERHLAALDELDAEHADDIYRMLTTWTRRRLADDAFDDNED